MCKHVSFALTDTELGETSLVEHVIGDIGKAKPAKIPTRHLPYVLKKELEDKLIKLDVSKHPSVLMHQGWCWFIRRTGH